MIKQLKMINKENNLIIINSKGEELFSVDLKEMIFNSQKFYDSFFSGTSAKIEYKLLNKIKEKEVSDYKKCARIYDIVCKIFDDIQSNLDNKKKQV